MEKFITGFDFDEHLRYGIFILANFNHRLIMQWSIKVGTVIGMKLQFHFHFYFHWNTFQLWFPIQYRDLYLESFLFAPRPWQLDVNYLNAIYHCDGSVATQFPPVINQNHGNLSHCHNLWTLEIDDFIDIFKYVHTHTHTHRESDRPEMFCWFLRFWWFISFGYSS